jgi:hypothetical protein
MKRIAWVSIWAIAALAVSVVIQVPARSKTPTKVATAFSVIARYWPGKWSCTETQTGKPLEAWTETATLYGDKWIKTIGTYPADGASPATGYESVLGYDDRLHQWVTVTFLANGGYGIDRSLSPKTSFTQIWVNAYPIDPQSNIPVTVVMTKSTRTVDGHYTEKGVRMTFHWDCIKQP